MKNFINTFKNFSFYKIFIVFFFSNFLVGCSAVPDAFNPVEWYKGARDAIIGDGEEKKEKSDRSFERGSSSASKGFSKLSTVPDRPKVLNKGERNIIAEGLVADLDASRKYSNEVIGRQRKGPNVPVISDRNDEPIAKTSSARKLLMSRVKTNPRLQSGPKTNSPGAYLVLPKPVKLSSLQNKGKSKSKIKNQVLSGKLKLTPPSKLKKLPLVNPNPPRIGRIPGLGKSFVKSETIIVSGSGVQRLYSTGDVRGDINKFPPSRIGISNLNYSGQLEKNNRQKSYQVATILFHNNSSKVGKNDRRILRKVAAKHRKVGGRLRVVGHASRRTGTNDPILHKMSNFQVSAARAERVAKELVKMGVNASKIIVGSVSDRVPRFYEYMPSGEAGNRRAEIFIDFL